MIRNILLALLVCSGVSSQVFAEDLFHSLFPIAAKDEAMIAQDNGKLSPADLKLLNHGLSLDGKTLKPATVRWQNKDQLNFILREGRKRQIRRMCELVGLRVVGLKRIRIGRVVLGDLPIGQWRYLRADEGF